MLYLAGIVLGVAAGYAVRGRLRHLMANVRFPWVWLVYAVLAAQIFLGYGRASWLTGEVKLAILLSSYGVLIAWLIVVAIKHPSWLRAAFVVIASGTLMNVIAIAPNRGIPVSKWAMQVAGATVPSGVANRFAVKHVYAGPDTVLNWLGDVIPVPPLRDVISIGDVVIGLGVALVVAAGMRMRPLPIFEAPAAGPAAADLPDPAPVPRSLAFAVPLGAEQSIGGGTLEHGTTVAEFLGRFAKDYAVGQAYDPMSEIVRHPAESRVMLSQAMSITDANLSGNVHGGVVMKLVDTAAGLSAIKHAHGRVVTVSMDEMSFIEPVFLTDVVTLTAQVNDVGRTSMEVGVRVEAENTVTGARRHVSSAYLVFVALDEEGKPRPVPRLEPETDEERRRLEEAKIRRTHRIARKAALLARRQAHDRGEAPPSGLV